MHSRTRSQSGQSTIEFVLVGIPMIFVMISTFEMARGMWIYQTLAHAVKDGARYASVHGKSCRTNPNVCGVTVGDVASRIQSAGTGLIGDDMGVTLTDTGGSIPCSTLTACLSNGTTWPTDAGGVQGSDLTVTASYHFHSALAMFRPGAGHVDFATVNFPAAARETVQF